MLFKNIYIFIKKSINSTRDKVNHISKSYTPAMRVASVEKDNNAQYVVTIQLLHKNTGFKINPIELLADDHVVNQFSPQDIRTLTYLGYLSISAPEYRILARKLSENSDQMLFAIHKNGEENYQFRTASEISLDPMILENLNQKDAHDIGFIAATEQIAAENKQKEEIQKKKKQDP